MTSKVIRLACLAGVSLPALLLAHPAHAGVSADEAKKLGTTLTPLGGEKAGNADGSIPAWAGGMADPNYKPTNGHRDDLFKGDKPLFSITSANMSQYADKLSEGTKAMFQKYPDSFRVDVYKTVRSASAPQWMYDNTAKNAVNGDIVEGGAGLRPVNVYGGIPFPIPKSGAEVIWNHSLAWRGVSWNFQCENVMVTQDGRQIQTSIGAQDDYQWPYYFPGGDAKSFAADGENFIEVMLVNDGPPLRAGEGILAYYNLDSSKDKAWVYLTGQRRVRMLPQACCDIPVPASAGVATFDDISVFYGRINRYDWKIVGKKEIYVPYNDNQFLAAKRQDALAEHHLNPDHVRWELHRVWVVDTTLAAGQRHLSPKGRYYFDEDTWTGLLAERYDANGQLWKMNWQLMVVQPDMPATAGQMFGFYDLISSAWYASLIPNNMREHFPKTEIKPLTYYTPENMAASGVR